MTRELKSTDAIFNFVKKTFEKWGYTTSEESSRLSNSRYLSIINFTEDKDIIIRFSDHDLPVSYDGLHGYHNVDICTGGVGRAGNTGNAVWYFSWLGRVADKYSLKLPAHIISLRARFAEEAKKKAEEDAALEKHFDNQRNKAKKIRESAIEYGKASKPEQFAKYEQYLKSARDNSLGNYKSRDKYRQKAKEIFLSFVSSAGKREEYEELELWLRSYVWSEK